MSTPVISVENLGKAYRIGLKDEVPDTLVGAATSWAKSPLRNLRRLRQLNTFSTNGSGEEDPGLIWALRDVSFEVSEGEVLGVIGRNGAGKSTLLKILSRITEPTRGRAVIRGRVSSLLEVGTGFHEELTGRENIYMNGTILGMRKKEIDRKLDEIIDFSGVEKFLDTPIKRYSSGMKVRLAFSVAAHLEPEILIIDEVLAVGDAEFQKKCLGKMQDVASGGRTVLLVSHNMAAISRLCKCAVYVRNGSVVSQGNVDEMVDLYNSSFSNESCRIEGFGFVIHAKFLDIDGREVLNWKYDTSLEVRIEVLSERELYRPAVDLAFYDEMGTRVFAVQSDRVAPSLLQASSRSFSLRFHFANTPFTCRALTLDIGIRDNRQGTYTAWWQSVRRLQISHIAAPDHLVAGTILSVPCKLIEG